MTSANTNILTFCLVDSVIDRWKKWSEIILPSKFTEVYVVSDIGKIKKHKPKTEGNLDENEIKQLPKMLVVFIHSSNEEIWTDSKIQADKIFWFASPGKPERRDLGERIFRKTELDEFEVTIHDIEDVIAYATGDKPNEKPDMCCSRNPTDPDFNWKQFEDLTISGKTNRKEEKQLMFDTFKYLHENKDKF